MVRGFGVRLSWSQVLTPPRTRWDLGLGASLLRASVSPYVRWDPQSYLVGCYESIMGDTQKPSPGT
jgi:hypothetical protein